MAIDIKGKLDAGETLSDYEIGYALDRGMALPEDYDTEVKEYKAAHVPGMPQGADAPVMATGPAFAQAPNGLLLTPEELNALTKSQLSALADVKGVDASGTKADMVSALGGGAPPEAPEADNDGEPEDEG